MRTTAIRTSPRIGVLALQGDVREHLQMLHGLGVDALAVRRESELAACDGLILPGGESTTMAKLARAFGVFEPIRARITDGFPVFGTCAGMILLADRVEDGTAGQETFGGLDITVRRNAFGRQVDSFEGGICVIGLDQPVHAVFIRAPWVERVGAGVEVLGTVPALDAGPEKGPERGLEGGPVAGRVTGGATDRAPGQATGGATGGAAGRIVAVRQGRLMATSFHPEVGGDPRLHQLFVDLVRTA
ncbi:MAG: pyridoxal 5'-phosphate synthase glutaminase subunit PdxT [Nocardioides sp.]